jgi:hypothetical protein
MKKLFLFVLLFSPVLFSCQKDKLVVDPDNPLIGIWNQSDYLEKAIVYTRQTEFSDNPCYKFNADGTLLERKNAGFCGTPPITYSDYDGSWSMLNDTIIQITSGYWGGTMTYKLDIESVSDNTLKVEAIYENL